MIIPFILILIVLIIIILNIKKESMGDLSTMASDLAGFPGRYIEAVKKGFENIGNLVYPASYKSCEPGYTEFPLTCTRGCGGFWNESWGAAWCNGPQQRPTYASRWLGGGRTGWDDCYRTWIVSCFNDGKGGHPAHTYNREAVCRGTDKNVSGICWPG